MRYLLLSLVLLLVGCSDKTYFPVYKPAVSTKHGMHHISRFSSVEAWTVRYKGFPDIPDSTYGLAPYDSSGVVTFKEFTAFRGVIMETDNTYLSAESYVYPFVLFPLGSKYDKYQLSGTLLCADLTIGDPRYPLQLHNEGTLMFCGSHVAANDTTYNFPVKRKGATLIVGETPDSISSITGAHVILPGGKEVWISHVGAK